MELAKSIFLQLLELATNSGTVKIFSRAFDWLKCSNDKIIAGAEKQSE